MATSSINSQSITIPADTTANRPGTPSDGMIRYNTSYSRSEVYSSASGGWIGYGDTLGTASNPATSATALYNAGITQNGYYWIKGNGATAYQIYCDFTTGGGKWMLLTQFPRNYTTTMEGSSYFAYSDQPTNSGPTATNSTTFWIPLSLFSNNGTGSDLDVQAYVYYSGAWRRFGAYWRSIPHSSVTENLGDSGGCQSVAASGMKVSGDGINWTTTPTQAIYKCEGWNGPTWTTTESGTYSYQDGSNNTGGIIFHVITGGTQVQGKIYGAVEGIGITSSDTSWDYGRVWVRVQ